MVQNLLRNFGSQSVINSPRRPQSIELNLLKKAYAYYSADQVSIPSTKVTCFKNLYVTNIIALHLSFDGGSASIKSRVSVKKGTEGESIG